MSEPTLRPIKAGWMARAPRDSERGGWAVAGATREEAIERYRAAEAWRAELRTRPFRCEIEERAKAAAAAEADDPFD